MKAHSFASTETLASKLFWFALTVFLHFYAAMAGDAMLLGLGFSARRNVHRFAS